MFFCEINRLILIVIGGMAQDVGERKKVGKARREKVAGRGEKTFRSRWENVSGVAKVEAGGRFYREKQVIEGKKGEKSADGRRISYLFDPDASDASGFFRQFRLFQLSRSRSAR